MRLSAVLFGLCAALLVVSAEAGAALRPFKSPSGNITCVISTQGGKPQFAQCELRSKGAGFSVRKQGRVTRYGVDPYDDLAGQRTVLGYGRTLRLGSFSCTSRQAGMTCRSLVSGHGFTISRQRQSVF